MVKLDVFRKLRIVGLLSMLFMLANVASYSQDVAMHTQGIMQQEFLNPAYNSFKDYVSLATYNRAQWGSEFEYSPKSYVANLFLPVSKKRLGFNLGFIAEDIGLRNTTELKLSLCHNVRLSERSYLAFGYSAGFFQNSFNRDKIVSYPDEDISFLLDQTDLNTLYPAVSVGMLLLTPSWYAGISSMTTSIHSNMDDSQYLPGFDFSCGAMFPLTAGVKMRPGLIIKYYNEKGIKSENGVVNDNYRIPAVYDLSANFLFANRVWLGTSHRFNQAHTFSVDLMIGKNIKAGYTFEYGIGDGLNQFNSHGIRLSFIFKRNHESTTPNGMDIWPGSGEEEEAIQNLGTIIY